MKVKEIMSAKPLLLSPEDSVSNFISLMEKYHIHEVPVVERKKLVGFATYKTLAEREMVDPTAMKISSIMVKPPTVSPEDDIERAAEVIFKNSFRALPVSDKGNIVGIISVFDIVSALSASKAFRQTSAESVMSVSEVIGDGDDIGKARVLMREKNISRLPLVDKNGKLKGVVTVFDLLKALKPRERMGWYSMAAEKLTIMGIPVSTVMNTSPPTASKDTSLADIASLMKDHKTSGVIITEDGGPVGVVTPRDILEFYFAKGQKGVYVQITGLSEDDDSMDLSTVDRIVKDSVQKLSAIFKPQSLFLRVKKYRKEGAKTKYSVRCRFMTDRGIFISRGLGWDLRDSVSDAMDSLEKIVLKYKDKSRDEVTRKKELERLKKKVF